MFIDANTPFEAFNVVVEMLQTENKILKEKANNIIPQVMSVGEWPKLSEFEWELGGRSSPTRLAEVERGGRYLIKENN